MQFVSFGSILQLGLNPVTEQNSSYIFNMVKKGGGGGGAGGGGGGSDFFFKMMGMSGDNKGKRGKGGKVAPSPRADHNHIQING